MPDRRDALRAVAWCELCPWLIIFRTFRLSIGTPVLFLALIAALLTPLGWRCGELLFVREDDRIDPAFSEFLSHASEWPGQGERAQWPRDLGGWPRYAAARLTATVRHVVLPLEQALGGGLSLTRAAYFALGTLWTLLVWSLLGGAITRLAVVQLGREERLTLREALGHARRHLVSYVVAPLFPLCAVAVFWLVNGFLGLMMRADAGLLAAGIVWPLVLLGGFLVTLLLAGLLISWPLMWVALSAEENSDAFDALSRSYSYALGRPLHYLGYAALAVAYGLLGWLVVSVFCEAVVRVSEQAVGWAVGGERLAEIQLVASGRGGSPTALMWAGGGLIGLFNGLVRALAMAFAYSFFWHAVSAIYLLLRRHVDETEFDEVFLEDEQRRYGLPELTRDAAGVPGVAETTVDGAADEPPPAGQSTATQPPSDAEESGRSLDH